MAVSSISGINVKIGADLSELKKQLGMVGDTVETELSPAKTSVDDLRDSFKSTAENTKASSENIQAIAQALQTVGTALLGFAKDSIEDALKISPETAASYESISGAFGDLKVALGEGLLSSLDGIAPTVTDLLNSITTFAKENPDTAGLLLGIVGAVGLLGSAAATAAPLLTLFGVSLAPIAGTAVAVAGAIVGLVAILAILSSTLDEIGDKASGTAEEIANMNTATQKIVENGIGELSVEDREIEFVPVWDEELGDFVETNAIWTENTYNPLTGDYSGYYVPVTESVNQATEAVTEFSEATTESMETTKSTSEQAMEIFAGMQESYGTFAESVTTEGLTEAMASAKELAESEAFQMFANQPVPEEVGASWQSFGDGINNASSGFSDIKSTLADGSVEGAVSGIGGTASEAAGSFWGMAESIYAAIDAYLALLRVYNGGGSGGGGKGKPVDAFKASGGPVKAGNTYIVGELGPEVFVPNISGTIIPNAQSSNTSNHQIVVNFNGDVIGDERSIYSMVNRAAKTAIREAVYAAG